MERATATTLEGAPLTDQPADTRWSRVLVAVVLLGVALRVAQWLAGHPVWHDEWMLLWNIEHKTVAELMGPLQMNQGAPPVFLAKLRALYVIFGESRLALRLPALVAGCATIGMTAVVAARLIGSPGAVVATALVALSDRMIWHSVEIKPYSVDTLVAVTLLYFAAAMRSPFGIRLGAVAITAAVGLWVSYTTLFAFAGIVLALLPQVWRERRGWLKLAAAGAVVAASFAAVWILVARNQRTARLAEAWTEDYVPWAKVWLAPFWFGRKTLELCEYPAAPVGIVVLALAIIGAIALWKSGRRERAAAILGPIAVTLAAAAAWKYPYGGSRATLFLVPGVFLLVGAGTEALRMGIRGPLTRWWWVGGVAILTVMLARAGYHVASPRIRTDAIRPLAHYVEQHMRPDDTICVVGQNGPWEFISYWDNRKGEIWPTPSDTTPAIPEWPTSSIADRRVWLVLLARSESQYPVLRKRVPLATETLDLGDQLNIKGGTAELYAPKSGVSE